MIIYVFITNIQQTTNQQLKNSQKLSQTLTRIMVCSHCNCAGHNKTTCQFLTTISPAEKRVAAELGAMLPPVKAKKVSKPLEGLACSMNIFKEPKVVKTKKHLKTCSGCGEKGHNARTCINICLPCPAPTSYCFSGLTAKQAVNLAHIMDCSPAY